MLAAILDAGRQSQGPHGRRIAGDHLAYRSYRFLKCPESIRDCSLPVLRPVGWSTPSGRSHGGRTLGCVPADTWSNVAASRQYQLLRLTASSGTAVSVNIELFNVGLDENHFLLQLK